MEIEFEGFYDKASFRKKEALTEKPSQIYLICRLVLALFLAIVYVPLVVHIIQSKGYFSRTSNLVVLILIAIYYLIIHTHVAHHFRKVPEGKESNPILSKGTISNQGITHYSTSDKVAYAPWSNIYRAKKTDALIILFIENSPSMAFPRSFFKSDANWQTFGKRVDFHVKK